MSTDAATPTRQFAQPVGEHISLGRSLRFIIWCLPLLALGAVLVLVVDPPLRPRVTGGILVVAAIVWGVLVSGVRVAAQWERGVVLQFGNYVGERGPGLLYIIPFMQYVRFVDLRVLALNIPSQKVITKDNVPASIDGVLFFRVEAAASVILKVQDYRFAISQYVQASLRDVVGSLSLDELLSERERIQTQIGQIIAERVKDWGVHVDGIRLLDIEMPEDLKRMMSRQASAEREKRANITKSEGDKLAAANLSAAAATMHLSPGAMRLRTLQTIDGLGAGPANTVVLMPVELTEALEGLAAKLGARAAGIPAAESAPAAAAPPQAG